MTFNMIFVLIAIFGLSAGLTFWDAASENPFLNTYFSNDNITGAFNQLQNQYPDLVEVHLLGTTPSGRRINEITITSNVSSWESAYKPHVKYVANMHGNEVRGRGLLLKLAYYLVAMSEDEDVKKILNTTVFHLVPTLNPDGFARAAKSCTGTNGRYTSEMKDMNRDFPNLWSDLRQSMDKETELVMKYADTVPAVLGISFHDGSLVVNYPWDAMKGVPNMEYAASPDDNLFVHLAKTYSLNHKTMAKSSSPCGVSYFEDGITNGNKWYQVFNGMQDWNYYYKDCFELTIELGCCKYPADAVTTYSDVWSDNFNSIFALTRLAQLGIRGKVVDHTGTPVVGAVISVSDQGKPVKVRHKDGYYWRPLLPGLYDVTASKPGYWDVIRRNIKVAENDSTEVPFILIAKSQVRGRKKHKQK